MEPSLAGPIICRNSRLVIALMVLLALASFVTAAGMGILALAELFPLHELTVSRAMGVASWLLGAVMSVSLGMSLWQMWITLAHTEVRLDQETVQFRLGSKNSAHQVSFAWKEISAIRHVRLGNNQYYGVFTQDGRVVEFSGLTFLRPKRMANLIAERAGLNIEEGTSPVRVRAKRPA